MVDLGARDMIEAHAPALTVAGDHTPPPISVAEVCLCRRAAAEGARVIDHGAAARLHVKTDQIDLAREERAADERVLIKETDRRGCRVAGAFADVEGTPLGSMKILEMYLQCRQHGARIADEARDQDGNCHRHDHRGCDDHCTATRVHISPLPVEPTSGRLP
jgi:hypothetical protein